MYSSRSPKSWDGLTLYLCATPSSCSILGLLTKWVKCFDLVVIHKECDMRATFTAYESMKNQTNIFDNFLLVFIQGSIYLAIARFVDNIKVLPNDKSAMILR